MKDQREEAKIAKYAEKKKSGPIIKLMDKADTEVLVDALTALGGIGDEDSSNKITHYLDHPDVKVRIAACRAALVIDTDYMKTRVRHQLAMEQDPEAKKEIQEALNAAKETRV
ncbi:MAG TPA: HEAT repeat domain-containing protein [Candidatus Eisenbergiella merdipullorum]|uniref:HEAT repeat domain-containing protein n=1 Tax=Candidatus Eisenbergiella merdipullorum TaxID=2838553 RepID=A0A9D2I5D2_9FIRM|nr:HEAT repeat domain-containing protein [Candidatus Eisenbergiella merdipullorum]